jgi:hypothetical protein
VTQTLRNICADCVNLMWNIVTKKLLFGPVTTLKNSNNSHEKKIPKVALVKKPGDKKLMQFPLM